MSEAVQKAVSAALDEWERECGSYALRSLDPEEAERMRKSARLIKIERELAEEILLRHLKIAEEAIR